MCEGQLPLSVVNTHTQAHRDPAGDKYREIDAQKSGYASVEFLRTMLVATRATSLLQVKVET